MLFPFSFVQIYSLSVSCSIKNRCKSVWDTQLQYFQPLFWHLCKKSSVFAPNGVLVMGIDDTIERRWGKRITARGIYRDPVRSNDSHLVKTSGLRWLSLMVLVDISWAHWSGHSRFSPLCLLCYAA